MDSAVSTIMTGVENLRIALQDVPGFRTVASAPYMFRPFIMLVSSVLPPVLWGSS